MSATPERAGPKRDAAPECATNAPEAQNEAQKPTTNNLHSVNATLSQEPDFKSIDIETLALFPLWPIVDGKCKCGDPACADIGKHPAMKWSELGIAEQEAGPEEWGEPGQAYGLGIATGEKSGLFVVDLDVKPDKRIDGIAAFKALGDCPETFTVQTPSGGLHLYFTLPDFPVKTSGGQVGPGIDIRGRGGYVVAPGSPHWSGGTYETILDVPLAPAPTWLLAMPCLRGRVVTEREAGELGVEPVDISTPEGRAAVEKAERFLREEAIAAIDGKTPGAGFKTALRLMRGYRLPLDVAHTLWEEIYNPRCEPPWSEFEIEHKLIDARDKASTPTGVPSEGFLERLAKLGERIPANDSAHSAIQASAEKSPAPTRMIKRQRLDWSAPVPPTEWIVEGLIAKETINLFTGPPNSLKTWSVLSLGLAVARGEPWLGRFQTRKGTVLVLDFETGTIPTRRRMHHFNPRATDLLEYAWCGGARLYEQEFWNELREDAPSLVIIDSLSRGSPGVDENSPEMALSEDLAKQWAEATGGAVIFIHHAGKSEGNAVRGSSAIKGAAEGVFVFSEVKEKAGPIKSTTMTCDRNKSSEGSAPIKLQFEKNKGMSMLEDEHDAAARDGDDSLDSIKTRIRLALRDGEPEIRDAKKLRSRVTGNDKDVRNAWAAMVEAGEATKIKGVFRLDGPEQRRIRARDAFSKHRGLGFTYDPSENELRDLASITKEHVSEMVSDQFLVRAGSKLRLAPARDVA